MWFNKSRAWRKKPGEINVMTFNFGIFILLKSSGDISGVFKSVEQIPCILASNSLKFEALMKTFSIMSRVPMLIFPSNLSKSLDDLSVSCVAFLEYCLNVLLVVSFVELKPVA